MKESSVDVMTSLIRQQVAFEKKVTERVREECAAAPYPDPATHCTPPA